MDCPPSYHEAIRLSRSGTLTPTAPPLGNVTNFSTNIGEQNDQQFGKWDEKATKIMIFQRLKMNDQFEAAKSLLETDKLWNLILLELLEEEYNHFSVHDLRQYWICFYQIYKSIVDNSSSVYDRNWVYFQPMDAVFGRQSNSLNITDPVTDLMIHDTFVNQFYVPITSQPGAFSNQVPTLDTVVTTQPTQTTVTGVPHTTISEEPDCCVECCNTCCWLCEQDYYDSSYNSGGYSNILGNDYDYHQTFVDTSSTNYQGGNDAVGDSGASCCDNSGGSGCHNSNSGGGCESSDGSECHNSNSGGGCDNSGGSGCDNSGSDGGCCDSGSGGCGGSDGGGYCDDSGGGDGNCDDSGGGGYDDSSWGGYDDSGGGGYDDGGVGCYDD